MLASTKNDPLNIPDEREREKIRKVMVGRGSFSVEAATIETTTAMQDFPSPVEEDEDESYSSEDREIKIIETPFGFAARCST